MNDVVNLPGKVAHPADRAPAARHSSKESALPRLPSLIETAATTISVARSAMSGEFPEVVHRAARACADDLAIIMVREHDTSLWKAISILVTNILELSEADSERRECWALALSVNLALVKALLTVTTRKMGLRK